VNGVALGKTHDREMGLHPHSGDLHDRLAEVELRLARWLGEGHEDLAVAMATSAT